MKPKKYPKADLNRDRGLFFVIGLTFVLFLVWRALEIKTYDQSEKTWISMENVEDLREEIPITEALRTPPPPPPPPAPVIIEVVEDEEEIEETVIESTESNEDAMVQEMAVDDIEVAEVEEEITVPFAVIEDVPIFPGCEAGTKTEMRACFQKMVQGHVLSNFRYPEIALEMGIQGKVYVQFLIDTQGKVTNIRTRGPDKTLEKEAHRIIASLPQMIPGKQRGRAVKVPYTVPVNFKLL